MAEARQRGAGKGAGLGGLTAIRTQQTPSHSGLAHIWHGDRRRSTPGRPGKRGDRLARTCTESCVSAPPSTPTRCGPVAPGLESRRSNIPAVILSGSNSFSLKNPTVRLTHCYKCCHRCNQRRQSAVVFQRKGSQREDESIDGHGRCCSGSLGRWCYVDRTIGLGYHPLLRCAPAQGRSRVQLRLRLRPG